MLITRQGSVVLRCSSQGDMLAAAKAGLGISALSCFVAADDPDLVRVAPQKLVSVADLWLLAHPDLVDLPAVRAVIDFVTVMRARGPGQAARVKAKSRVQPAGSFLCMGLFSRFYFAITPSRFFTTR